MPRPTRLAFCGCGRIARAHAKEFSTLPDVTLHSYWDRDPSLAEGFHADHGGAYWTEDFGRIADDAEVDAVYINTMHCDRARLVKAMAQAGKPIFSEKPLAHNRENLRQIHHILQTHDTLFWSGYKIRFNSIMEKARTLLPKPEVINVNVHDETWPEGYLNDPDVGGGNVQSQGVYATETARLLAGCRPVAVSAFVGRKRHEHATPDTLCATYEFENGALAAITVSDAGCPPPPASKFSAIASGGNRSISLLDRFTRLEFLDNAENHSESLTFDEDGFRRQSEAFLRAVRGEGENQCDLTEGAIPSIMIYRAIDAADSGKREKIDIEAFLSE